MTGFDAPAGAPPNLTVFAARDGIKPRSMREHRRVIQACTACAFRPDDAAPLMGDGPIPADLVVVSHAARPHDMLMGRGLAGAARNVVDAAVQNAGITHRVRFTAALRCAPPDDVNTDREDFSPCRDHLLAELMLASPQVIVTLGPEATTAVVNAELPFDAVVGRPLRLTDTVTLLPTVDPMGAVQGRRDATVALRRDFLLAHAVLTAKSTSA